MTLDPSLLLLSFLCVCVCVCARCIICVIWCFIFYLVGLQHRMSDCSKRVMSNHIRYNRPNRRALYRNLGIGSCSNRNIPSVCTKCHIAMFRHKMVYKAYLFNAFLFPVTLVKTKSGVSWRFPSGTLSIWPLWIWIKTK